MGVSLSLIDSVSLLDRSSLINSLSLIDSFSLIEGLSHFNRLLAYPLSAPVLKKLAYLVYPPKITQKIPCSWFKLFVWIKWISTRAFSICKYTSFLLQTNQVQALV